MARGHRSGFQKKISEYEWARAVGLITSMDVNAEALGSVTLVALESRTIMRFRGRVYAQLDAGAVDERVSIMCGIRVATDDAVAAGVAAVGNPFDDELNGWVWTGTLFVSSGAEGTVVEDSLTDRIEIDSKAMRKVKASNTIVFVAVTPPTGAVDQTGTGDILYDLSILTGSG